MMKNNNSDDNVDDDSDDEWSTDKTMIRNGGDGNESDFSSENDSCDDNTIAE